MSQDDFTEVFFEEAAEHLQAVEDELLVLDGDPGNEESLNAVFRAAHSIKGSAGMFGFATLADFTHHLETLLDLIRKGKADLTDVRVDLTLEAVDEIRRLVDELAEGQEAPPASAPLTDRLIVEVAEAQGDEAMADGTPASVPEDDDSFGLFDEEAGAEDDSFGLFDDHAGGDDSFGLFEDNPGQSAYAGYLDEMFREGEAEQPTRPEQTGNDADATEPAETGSADVEPPEGEQPKRDPDADPDGKFGWLNRPDKRPEATAKSTAPAKRPNGNRSDNGSGSLRVSLGKVDELVNQISELVITQAMLQETASELDPVANERHLATLETLERNTRELQESVLSIRLLPVSFLFSRFPRVVRDLSRNLGKTVELVTIGEQTELDKSLIEKLSDPLTHLVRNSIDHGIEAPEARDRAGKPGCGQVVMAAAHEGGNIVISISDDGAGINRSKVLAKARENGLAADDSWSDEQVYGLIFEPGFSTAAAVTEVSGRGVGMDVVKRNIQELGGTIEVKSSPGQGSIFTVRLPLTLAITDGMVVRSDQQRFVVPLSNVTESLQLDAEDIFDIQGRSRVIRRHGDFLSLRRLSHLLEPGRHKSDRPEELAIVVESDGKQLGLVVDELVGQQQIVIKNLESNYRKVRGFSGATVMGDGSVAFILDIAQLIACAETDQPVEERLTQTLAIPEEDK